MDSINSMAAVQSLPGIGNDENCSSAYLHGSLTALPHVPQLSQEIPPQKNHTISQAGSKTSLEKSLAISKAVTCCASEDLVDVDFKQPSLVNGTSKLSVPCSRSYQNCSTSGKNLIGSNETQEHTGLFANGNVASFIERECTVPEIERCISTSVDNTAADIIAADILDEIDDNSTQLRFSPPALPSPGMSTIKSSFAASEESEFILNDIPSDDNAISSPIAHSSTEPCCKKIWYHEVSKDNNLIKTCSVNLSASQFSIGLETSTSSGNQHANSDKDHAEQSNSSLDSGNVSFDDQDHKTMCNGSIDAFNSDDNSTNKRSRKRPKSCLSPASTSCLPSSPKKIKSGCYKMVTFSGVSVYYFSRRQSFVTVPSQGGSTLGMSLTHDHMKEMTLKQHRKLVARRKKQMVKEQNRQQRISSKLKQLKQSYPQFETSQLMTMVIQTEPELEEECCSELSSDDEDGNDNSDDDDENYFPQPIPTKKRRLLLRMSGVQKIDSDEKLSNKLTRESREVCGCDCVGVCIPSRCICAQAGIPCQVDRESFPCGCFAAGCRNESGRVEFDAERVRRHFVKTMTRLRFEEAGKSIPEGDPLLTPVEPRPSPYVSLTTANDTALATSRDCEIDRCHAAEQKDGGGASNGLVQSACGNVGDSNGLVRSASGNVGDNAVSLPGGASLATSSSAPFSVGGDLRGGHEGEGAFYLQSSFWNSDELPKTPCNGREDLQQLAATPHYTSVSQLSPSVRDGPYYIEPKAVDACCLSSDGSADFTTYLNRSSACEATPTAASFSPRFGTTRSSAESTFTATSAFEKPLRLDPITSFFQSSSSRPEIFLSSGTSAPLASCTAVAETTSCCSGTSLSSGSGASPVYGASQTLQYAGGGNGRSFQNIDVQRASSAAGCSQDAVNVTA